MRSCPKLLLRLVFTRGTAAQVLVVELAFNETVVAGLVLKLFDIERTANIDDLLKLSGRKEVIEFGRFGAILTTTRESDVVT